MGHWIFKMLLSGLPLFLICSGSFAMDSQNGTLLSSDYMDGVIGVELVTAHSNDGPVYSRWGHSLLLLVNPSIALEKNLIISFVADVEDEKISNFKGLFGKYLTKLQVYTFEDVWGEYALLGRSIGRLPLTLSKNQLEVLLNDLFKMTRGEIPLPRYKFLSANCASQLSFLFQRVFSNLNKTRFPERQVDILMKYGIAFIPEFYIPTAKQTLTKLANKLNIGILDLLKYTHFSQGEMKVIETAATHSELYLLIMHVPTLAAETKAQLKKVFLNKFGDQETALHYNLRSIPNQLYILPKSDAEKEKFRSALDLFLSSPNIKIQDVVMSAQNFLNNIDAISENQGIGSDIYKSLTAFVRLELVAIPHEKVNLPELRLQPNGKVHLLYTYYMNDASIRQQRVDVSDLFFIESREGHSTIKLKRNDMVLGDITLVKSASSHIDISSQCVLTSERYADRKRTIVLYCKESTKSG